MEPKEPKQQAPDVPEEQPTPDEEQAEVTVDGCPYGCPYEVS